VAPYLDESKEWKTSDTVKAYCTKCNFPIPWTVQNAKHVQRHLTNYHGDYLNKKRKGTATTADDEQQKLNNYFCKKLRNVLAPAVKSYQTKGEIVLV